jgi:hypothetical protein
MADPLLTPAQHGALSKEADDATGLFSHGLALLRRLHTSVRDSAAVFALLSTGAEKLLKLTVGITFIEETARWPSRDFMRKKMRHRILLLDQTAREALWRRRNHGTAPGHMDHALAVLDADVLLSPMLAALDRYSSDGRFFYLDTLADNPQPQPSPAELWDQVLHQVLSADPDTLHMIADPKTYAEGRQAMNKPIADSMQRWWQTHQRGWTTGVLGWRAQTWANVLDLFDVETRRPLPKTD